MNTVRATGARSVSIGGVGGISIRIRSATSWSPSSARPIWTTSGSAWSCPDGTRTCPLPLILQRGHRALTGRAKEVTVLIALGTHQAMSEEALARISATGPGELEETYPGWEVVNHESWLPETFTTLGTIGADRMTELTGGLMTDTQVDVRINRHVADADVAIVVGPVFPHEVVGFSGGNKYFFPGRLRTRADRRVPLGRRPDHQRRDDRHPRSHPGPRPGQRGRLADPRRAAGALPGRRVRRRHPARGGVRHPGGRLGGLRGDLRRDPRQLPRPPRTGGCCRSCPPSTRTSGPRPRASTSWNRSSPTAAR